MSETAIESPLHILHVHADAETRGDERQTLALIENLTRRGHGQTLLAPAETSIAVAASALGFDVRPLTLPAIVELSPQYDLVHAHDTRAHSMAAATARVPVVATRRLATRIRRGPGFRWKYRRTRRFIAVSHYIERLLLDAAILQERISVVYEGVEAATAEPEAGRSLILAPNTDHLRHVLEEAARIAGTAVHFSDDPSADLPRARAFVYMVGAEASAVPVLEAMAHGVPVVATRVGALPEIIEDGQTGILAETDPQSLAAALARVLENSELGANARVRAADKFGVDRMVRSTVAVYREVLAPPPPPQEPSSSS